MCVYADLRYSSVAPPQPNLRAGANPAMVPPGVGHVSNSCVTDVIHVVARVAIFFSPLLVFLLSFLVMIFCSPLVFPHPCSSPQFDGSSKWPEDANAIARCIQAFLLAMKDE